MSEAFPNDSYLENLSGVTDSLTGVYYPVKGEGLDWYVSFVKCIYRLVRNVSVASGLRVYKITGLTFGVKSGKFFDGKELREYSGTESGALSDNTTNYIYLLADGTLVVNVSGFPDASSTRHIRLATILTANGSYDDDDIVDYRQCNIWSVAGLVGSSEVSDEIADAMPKIDISVGAESSDTIAVTVQVQDIQGNNLAGNYLIRAWLADSQYAAECVTGPNSGTSWTSGTVLETQTSDKRWLVITDSTGKAVIDISDTGTPTYYLNVEIDGKIYASSAITFS